MKFSTPIVVLMAFATSQAIAAPAAETVDLETRADYCVDVKICHGYNWEGGCYNECKRPGEPHGIRKEWRKNAGSFKIGDKGYTCQIASPNHGTLPASYPGTKKFRDQWKNNIEGYQCNKV